MIKLELYTGTKTYIFNNHTLATPDIVRSRYPAAATKVFVVFTDSSGEMFNEFYSLAALRDRFDVPTNYSEQEAIEFIEAAVNSPPIEPEPSAEERIAAALEFQNLKSL